MEDESSLLGLLTRYLSRSGFEVVACATPDEALAAGGEFAAAVVDYSLPGMNGEELLARLRGAAPQLPAVLTSGAPLYVAEGGATRFLQKPFSPRQLVDMLRQDAAA
ncbi:MAG: response regulator [Bryobacteraceae bacterium]